MQQENSYNFTTQFKSLTKKNDNYGRHNLHKFLVRRSFGGVLDQRASESVRLYGVLVRVPFLCMFVSAVLY